MYRNIKYEICRKEINNSFKKGTGLSINDIMLIYIILDSGLNKVPLVYIKDHAVSLTKHQLSESMKVLKKKKYIEKKNFKGDERKFYITTINLGDLESLLTKYLKVVEDHIGV